MLLEENETPHTQLAMFCWCCCWLASDCCCFLLLLNAHFGLVGSSLDKPWCAHIHNTHTHTHNHAIRLLLERTPRALPPNTFTTSSSIFELTNSVLQVRNDAPLRRSFFGKSQTKKTSIFNTLISPISPQNERVSPKPNSSTKAYTDMTRRLRHSTDTRHGTDRSYARSFCLCGKLSPRNFHFPWKVAMFLKVQQKNTPRELLSLLLNEES